MSEPHFSEEEVIAAYRIGVEEGMRRYAWWKDGTEWVGTCGTTLAAAILRFRAHRVTLTEATGGVLKGQHDRS